MHEYVTGARKTAPTTVAPTQNHRVTAEIVVDEDGEARTLYRAQGREFVSLTALKSALGVTA